MSRIVIAGLENISAELGCSKKTLYKWIRTREFPAFKMDGVWRAMPREIESWFSCQREQDSGSVRPCRSRGCTSSDVSK